MPKGKHREDYQRPRKGEKRRTEQPFKLDALPAKAQRTVQEAREGRCVCEGRKAHFHTWQETAALASKAAGESVSVSGCHRWYDVRVEQRRAEELSRNERVRELAAAFAGRGIKDLPAATLNALAGEAFAVLDAGSPEERQASLGNLLFLQAKLIDAQAKQKRAEIEEEKLGLAKKKFEELRNKAEKELNAAQAKLGKGKQLTAADIDRIREHAFGLPPRKREATVGS